MKITTTPYILRNSIEPADSDDYWNFGINGRHPCIVDGGVCRSREGAIWDRAEHIDGPCKYREDECAVLPGDVTQ